MTSYFHNHKRIYCSINDDNQASELDEKRTSIRFCAQSQSPHIDDVMKSESGPIKEIGTRLDHVIAASLQRY